MNEIRWIGKTALMLLQAESLAEHGGLEGIRDEGLLESALARPRASVFGQDAYPELHLKAAALLHSLARNHALVDGNKRLAWTACRTFLAINGQWISAPEDDRFEFIIQVAAGTLADLDKMADRLRTWSYQEG